MLHVQIDLLNDLTSVVLSNEVLELTVLPQTGARIYSIVHKPSQTEFLWHHPLNQPRRHKPDDIFDDVFPGGWDELFPTCDACTFDGLTVPDHGELWAKDWEWHMEDNACLYTGTTAMLFPVLFERRLYLDDKAASFILRYRLKNMSSRAHRLIWGMHPLFAVTPYHRLELPAGEMLVGWTSSGDIGQLGQRYQWPYLPTQHGFRDMRYLPGPTSNLSAGHYAMNPQGNWFALTDTKKQVSIAMVYPAEIFRSLWVWQTYGQWRGLYHLAVEPWVGYPVKLDEAVAAGRCFLLAPRQVLEYDVSVGIYSGLAEVGS
jgi:hypothetical protein